MTELYLIAHRVRGEPAFDIATHMDCPECGASGCPECDDLGYWWIVPTSGHRAYPLWHHSLNELQLESGTFNRNGDMCMISPFDMNHRFAPEAFDRLPDHYIARAAPKVSLIEALGLRKPASPSAPTAPFPRRL